MAVFVNIMLSIITNCLFDYISSFRSVFAVHRKDFSVSPLRGAVHVLSE